MTSHAPRRWADEAGFTLVELLVVIAILGIIGYALTESVILGFRTTDATAASSSRSVAVRTLTSYFTADAQSADLVSIADPNPSDPPCATGPVFLHLTWTDAGVSRAVSYGLDPVGGSERDLVRWSCTGGAIADRKVLGHFSGSPNPAMPPVSATCYGGPAADCPATPGGPATITLDVQADPPLSLTVRRRAT